VQPKDIYALVSVGAPRVSPDGSTIAFVVTRVDEAENRYRSQVWLVPADGSSAPLPYSNGEHGDGNPTWSPDGRRLAFTSRRQDKHSTLHVRPVVGGGETVTLASLPESIGGLAWSPDGAWLAFTARARSDRYDGDDERKHAPRRITRFFSRLNDEGWVADRPQHVWVVPADGSAQPRDLTPGEFEFADPSWAPDSNRLVVSGATHDTWDLDLANDLLAVTLEEEPDAMPVPLTKERGRYAMPSWSPGGSLVAFLGTDDAMLEPANMRVGLLDVRTGEQKWVSTKDREYLPYGAAIAPQWDEATVLVLMEDRGDVRLQRIPLGGGEESTVVDGEQVVVDARQAGGTLAFAATTPTTLPEIYVLDAGGPRKLTSFGDAFARRAEPLPAERFTAPSTGGANVDAWVVTPPGFDPAQRYPALLMIHGGPFAQYANRFFDEVQLYASAGYVVLYANPRGSSGREDAWGQALRGPKARTVPGTGWGTVDYDDLMAVVDEALRRYPAIDPDRLGVLGGSYGGYMTSWIVSHTDRFRAACSERAVNNVLTLEYSSDIATAFRTMIGVTHLEDPTEYLSRSPISYAQRIHTPLLIIHSEDDLRCPIEQAEQLFVALRMLERDVEFVRFPAESHELSRSGSPVHRVQRAEIILEFFAKHLQPAPDDADGPDSPD
jgi:dipeptidyl aminopeptidase/acylaminoacyl peptidase